MTTTQAIRMMTGGKRKVPPAPSKAAFERAKKKEGGAGVFFGDESGDVCTVYKAMESWPKVSLTVMRMPATGVLTVEYYTVSQSVRQAVSQSGRQAGRQSEQAGNHSLSHS